MALPLGPWGYSDGVVKCDTAAAAAYLSKESGRRRPGFNLCRAHMSKCPPARQGPTTAATWRWGLALRGGRQRQAEASRYLLSWSQLAKHFW